MGRYYPRPFQGAWRAWGLSLVLLLSLSATAQAFDSFSFGGGAGGGGPRFFFNGLGSHGPQGAVDNEEYYKLLGVEKGADAAAIKRAYRRLAIKMHPDKGGDPEQFKLLGEAYEVLSDKEKRRTYDKYGKAGLEGGTPPPSDADDLLSALFGRAPQSGPRRARDETYQLEVSLEDLCRGRSRRVRVWKQKMEGGRAKKVPKELDIQIEKGMRTGSRVVMHGEVDAGASGVAPGDLVFVIKETKHPVFTRMGAHLSAEITLTLAEALLGFVRPILLPDGRTVYYKSEEGSVVAPGDVRKLKGCGMPVHASEKEAHESLDPHGDLYLHFHVRFPSRVQVHAWTEQDRDVLAKLLPPKPSFAKSKGATSAGEGVDLAPAEASVAERIKEGTFGDDAREQEGPHMPHSYFRFFGL